MILSSHDIHYVSRAINHNALIMCLNACIVVVVNAYIFILCTAIVDVTERRYKHAITCLAYIGTEGALDNPKMYYFYYSQLNPNYKSYVNYDSFDFIRHLNYKYAHTQNDKMTPTKLYV